MEIFGKSPVHPVTLIIGKLCFVICISCIGLQFFRSGTTLIHHPVLQFLSACLIGFGSVIGFASFFHLGESLKVGLPESQTSLKTLGLYRISRNPIYLGFFIVCIGACLYCFHPVTLISTGITFFIHHRIILREEIFLAERFGDQWTEYKNKVRRYF
jgi:protein-S-isoprenylcysteine O-methyltransferase Ste14